LQKLSNLYKIIKTVFYRKVNLLLPFVCNVMFDENSLNVECFDKRVLIK